jgi:3-oxoacyl-[acyl-carrier protein] reductase
VVVPGACDAVVVDATGWASSRGLDRFRAEVQPAVTSLTDCGRVVVLTRAPGSHDDVEGLVTGHALQALARSLGKELGRRGTTVNVVRVEDGADRWAWAPVAFLLSARSAYVSGEVIKVCQPPGGPSGDGLQGQRAVVTGAGQGIGLAVAQRLAEEGARVVGVDLPGRDVERSMHALGGAGLSLDVTQEGAVAQVREASGPIHVLVHNAGITRDRTFKKVDEASWRSVLDVNLHAPLEATRELLRDGLVDNARVVLVSSVSGVAGNAGQTAYAAAKAGLLGMVAAWEGGGGPRGVAVNAVAPGFIHTAMTERMPWGVRAVAQRINALGQGGLPADVAEAVTFLARPDSAGVRGAVLRVCGLSLVGR